MINFREPTIEDNFLQNNTTNIETEESESSVDYAEKLQVVIAKCQDMERVLKNANKLEELEKDDNKSVDVKKANILHVLPTKEGVMDALLDSTKNDWLARPAYYLALAKVFWDKYRTQ